jgi:hypothetical protein
MTAPLTSTPEKDWAGWLRTTGRRQLVITDLVRDECLARLLAYVERPTDRNRDVPVVRAGENPNRRPPRLD